MLPMKLKPGRHYAACFTAIALLAGLPIITGCSREEKKPAKSASTAKDDHGHDHDSQLGHSHDDGHDHDHAEDHDHDSQPGHSHDDGHDHDHGDAKEKDHDAQPGHSHDDGHDHDHGDEAGHEGHDHGEPGTGAAVPINAQVRQNLGITFAKAEFRQVESTIRMPGRFEPLPSAMREYHAPLAGRVELLVRQYDKVTTGQPLYELDSGEWRRMQQDLLTVEAEVAASSASLMSAQVARESGDVAEGVTRQRIEAADDHIASLMESIKLAEERERQMKRLQDIVGGRMADVNEARSQLASLRNELSQAREDRAELSQQSLQLSTESAGGAFMTTETLRAGLTARRAEYEGAKARRDLLRSSLISIMGDQPGGSFSASSQTWLPSAKVTIYAAAEGIVTKLGVTSGGYLDSNGEVMSVLDPAEVRFRAVALQSDFSRLKESMRGRILPPGKGTTQTIEVTVNLAVEADPDERTMDVVAEVPAIYSWVRTGLSTDLELVLDETEKPEIAIPNEAIVQDGLDKIFFRRDPENPDQAFRVKAHLGLGDGRWTAIEDGLSDKDEVVLHGVYELKLATAEAPEKAGHFHADGTFHEGED